MNVTDFLSRMRPLLPDRTPRELRSIATELRKLGYLPDGRYRDGMTAQHLAVFLIGEAGAPAPVDAGASVVRCFPLTPVGAERGPLFGESFGADMTSLMEMLIEKPETAVRVARVRIAPAIPAAEIVLRDAAGSEQVHQFLEARLAAQKPQGFAASRVRWAEIGGGFMHQAALLLSDEGRAQWEDEEPSAVAGQHG